MIVIRPTSSTHSGWQRREEAWECLRRAIRVKMWGGKEEIIKLPLFTRRCAESRRVFRAEKMIK